MKLTRHCPVVKRRQVIYAMDAPLIPVQEGTNQVNTDGCRIVGTDPTGKNHKFPCSPAALRQAVGRNDAGKAVNPPLHLMHEAQRFVVCLDEQGAVVRTDLIKDIEPGRLERSKETGTVDVRVYGDELGTLSVEEYPKNAGFEVARTILSAMSDASEFQVGDTFGSGTIESIDGNLVHLSLPSAE
jgi:hypothetical protein